MRPACAVGPAVLALADGEREALTAIASGDVSRAGEAKVEVVGGGAGAEAVNVGREGEEAVSVILVTDNKAKVLRSVFLAIAVSNVLKSGAYTAAREASERIRR